MKVLNENYEVEEDGNILKCRNGKLTLKLQGQAMREIGQLYTHSKSGKVWYVKGGLKASKHVMRKNDSWGLMWCVLERLPEDARISIESDVGSYKIALQAAKQAGSFLWFKTQGFEKQFFVPRSNWIVS